MEIVDMSGMTFASLFLLFGLGILALVGIVLVSVVVWAVFRSRNRDSVDAK